MKIAAIHGINVSFVERVRLPARWGKCLVDAGIDVSVHGAPWESTGTIQDDLRLVLTDEKWRRRQIAMVRQAIDEAKPDLIIGHSMGAFFAVAAQQKLPIVTIGSPLGHPTFGLTLLPHLPPVDTKHAVDCWNVDDDVCCIRAFRNAGHVQRTGWQSIRIAIAGEPGFAVEHHDELYLRHPLVQEAVRNALGCAVEEVSKRSA